jgi:hypothetical protein
MVTTEKRARTRALKLLAASAALMSFGAFAVASPFPLSSTSFLADTDAPPHPKLAPLGAGPAIQLARAAEGYDEDCVRLIRVVGPDVKSHAHGLVCGETR